MKFWLYYQFIFMALVSLANANGSLEKIDPELKATQSKSKSDFVWQDARRYKLTGFGWEEAAKKFQRLPDKAKDMVRSHVWSLSKHAAGGTLEFSVKGTNRLGVRWKNSGSSMHHMNSIGCSGLDLYVVHEGKWRWLRSFSTNKKAGLHSGFVSLDPTKAYHFRLYMPLYNGLQQLDIGLPAHVKFTQSESDRKPVVIYGTSITQGACASRPGMAYTAILGRWLDREVINLGFSGNGKLEEEIAQLMAEIDAAAYLIDCLPNMYPNEFSQDQIRDRAITLVEILRKARPEIPIVLSEDRSYANDYFNPKENIRRLALDEAYKILLKKGVKKLSYVKGDDLLGDDSEGTVDNSHPNDLGMWRMAEAFYQVMKPILN